jgi:MinD-like ATPase involved in chromosome partitioning or flagellar assembly
MVLVAVASNRGSPGGTTTALALAAAWPAHRGVPLLVEADPDGGVLAARAGLGIKPGLIELCGRARVALTDDDVWSFAQELPGGVPVLVAHPAAEQCHAALRAAGPRLAEVLAAMPERDAIVDVGRLRPGSPASTIVGRADVLVVVVRPTVEEIAAVVHRAAALRDVGLGLVLIGDRPYAAREVAAATDLPVVGVIADDERGAHALAGGAGSRALARTPLVRSAAAVAERLLAFAVPGSGDVADVEHLA